MISCILPSFRKAFGSLPKEIQKQAKEAYKTWKKNPYDLSLNFKQVHPSKAVYSVRITLNWRALGVREPQSTVTWFWIGSHEEYNNLVKQLRK
jgi:mRNA-degrading endonuclease RelE of RelBE toxin-antitoxin system